MLRVTKWLLVEEEVSSGDAARAARARGGDGGAGGAVLPEWDVCSAHSSNDMCEACRSRYGASSISVCVTWLLLLDGSSCSTGDATIGMECFVDLQSELLPSSPGCVNVASATESHVVVLIHIFQPRWHRLHELVGSSIGLTNLLHPRTAPQESHREIRAVAPPPPSCIAAHCT